MERKGDAMEWQLMTEEQKDITGMVRKFLENELAPVVKEYEEKGEFPMEVFRKCGELGIWGLISRRSTAARALTCSPCR